LNVSIQYSINDLAEIIKGKFLQHGIEQELNYLLLDSRKLVSPESTLFFAINHRRKGGDYISELYHKGVRSFVISESKIPLENYPEANFILVNNTLKALHRLAIHHRNRFTISVIGITGSNGKTIVKEWLNQLLEDDHNMVRSPKSYNSQIGVPLSILQMSPENDLAIFEAGISTSGEMQTLEAMIRPTIGIFTHAGEAHSEGFRGMREKLDEKLKLFLHAELLIYCSDNTSLKEAVYRFIKRKNKGLKLFDWSTTHPATLFIPQIIKTSDTSIIQGSYDGREVTVSIPFTDNASIENAITCWCFLLQQGLSNEIISGKMARLNPVQMRLELKQGINDCLIINDSYSADIDSLSIALDFLEQQATHERRTVILSDILQSGRKKEKLYKDVATILSKKKVDRLIGIGASISQEQSLFQIADKHFYPDIESFLKDFRSYAFQDETILLKGARIFEFEKIDQLLELKVHQTILSINLSSILHNLNTYRSRIMPSTKIMAMVKAFSYGSGSHEIAGLLEFHKVDYLAVAYADEGVALRKSGIVLPVMVMNPELNTFKSLVEHSLQPEIFSFAVLYSFEKYLQSAGIDNFPVHIKLDTGMHRLGFNADEIAELGTHLKNSRRIKVVTVFSHLVASEDPASDEFTQSQFHLFQTMCDNLSSTLGYPFLRHIANTEAITRHPEIQMDMVRLGIGLYGVDTEPLMQSRLKTVGTLTTTIAQIRKVGEGESVGYGRKWLTKRDSLIAIVRIGYADGYPRSLSNGRGKMLIGDHLVPVIGNVCMDMAMLDITGIAGINEGDEVIVFGEKLPIAQLAEWADTIPYEIMTGVSQRVKRVYYEE